MALSLDASCVTSFVDVAGVRTSVLKCGEGPPLLLIHGGAAGGCASVNWKKNIIPLAQAGFAVYAYDQPGFGKSSIPSDHSLEFRVQHAIALIQSLNLGPVHVMANSQGAYIGARVALDGKVNRLVLVSSGTLAPSGSAESRELQRKHQADLDSYQPSLEAMRTMTEHTLFKRELVTDELVRERYEMSVGPLYDAMIARTASPKPMSIGDRLGEIKNRTLIIWGDRDAGVAVENGLLLFERIADAEFHVFHDAAHWVHWDQAERFNRLVTTFLSAPD